MARATGEIHFCRPWPGSVFWVTWITPKRSRSCTSRVTALRSRPSLLARTVIDPGVSFTCLSSVTRFSVKTLSRDSASSKAITLLAGMRSPRSASRAVLRPRSKKASGLSTRISVFRTLRSFHQCRPFTIETRFDSLETVKRDRRHLAHGMAMMSSMGGVIAEHAAMVARVHQRIHVREVVSHKRTLGVRPDFAPQYAASLPPGQVKPLLGDFPNGTSHDL